MSFRKALFWLHLVAGVVAGVIILVMSVTGVLLAYERQIVAASDARFRSEPPSSGAAHLPVEALLAKVREQETNAVPSGVTLRADPAAAATVSFGQNRTVFANPYTGVVLGHAGQGPRPFFRFITDWHRWLGREGEGRAVGKAITGACNLAFLFLVLSGLYLWFPRQWTKGAFKAVTVFNGKLSGKARDWNWHNVIGFWSALPLVLVVASGVVISYPWAGNLVYRLTGTEPLAARGAPAAQTAPGGPRREGGEAGPGRSGPARTGESPRATGSRPSAGPAEIQTEGLDKAWAVAANKVSGWNYVSLRFPQRPGDPLTFLIDRGNGARPDLRGTLTLDARTGEEVRWQDYASQNAGQKARGWIRWIHTGEAGGWIGQTLAMLASAGGAVLVWTGLALSWRRFFKRKAEVAAANMSPTPGEV
jgi:uncharacterized iron-regulated membrane protein